MRAQCVHATCIPGKAAVGTFPAHMAVPTLTQKAKVTSLFAKLGHAWTVFESLPDGSLVLFSDLDVMPLRPYSELLHWLGNSSQDLVFMHEPQPSGSEEDVYNRLRLHLSCAPK